MPHRFRWKGGPHGPKLWGGRAQGSLSPSLPLSPFSSSPRSPISWGPRKLWRECSKNISRVALGVSCPGRAKQVEAAILAKDLGPALRWCEDNASRLRKLESKLEFHVRERAFLEMVRADKKDEVCRWFWSFGCGRGCWWWWVVAVLLFGISSTCGASGIRRALYSTGGPGPRSLNDVLLSPTQHATGTRTRPGVRKTRRGD